MIKHETLLSSIQAFKLSMSIRPIWYHLVHQCPSPLLLARGGGLDRLASLPALGLGRLLGLLVALGSLGLVARGGGGGTLGGAVTGVLETIGSDGSVGLSLILLALMGRDGQLGGWVVVGLHCGCLGRWICRKLLVCGLEAEKLWELLCECEGANWCTLITLASCFLMEDLIPFIFSRFSTVTPPEQRDRHHGRVPLSVELRGLEVVQMTYALFSPKAGVLRGRKTRSLALCADRKRTSHCTAVACSFGLCAMEDSTMRLSEGCFISVQPASVTSSTVGQTSEMTHGIVMHLMKCE
ncbi:hypothetical protein F4808DRAFT_328947 [Astrocystis sublimbata]|nr:hypothetical protein F4808DRAFT_328947 [Astrocystis sublimbata]